MTQEDMNEISHHQQTTVKDVRIAHWIYRMAIIILCLIVLILGTLYYWTLVPLHALNVKNTPMQVRPDPVHPQSAIFVHFDYCKTVKAIGHVRTSLVTSSTEIFQPMSTDRQSKGCYVVDAPLLLPSQAGPGKYRVHYHVVYQVNPIRTIVEDFYSRQFTVQ